MKKSAIFLLSLLPLQAFSAYISIYGETDGPFLQIYSGDTPEIFLVDGKEVTLYRHSQHATPGATNIQKLQSFIPQHKLRILGHVVVKMYDSIGNVTEYKDGSHTINDADFQRFVIETITPKKEEIVPAGRECLVSTIDDDGWKWSGHIDKQDSTRLIVQGTMTMNNPRMQHGLSPGPALFNNGHATPDVFGATPERFKIKNFNYKTSNHTINEQFHAALGEKVEFLIEAELPNTNVDKISFIPKDGHSWGQLNSSRVSLENVKFYCN